LDEHARGNTPALGRFIDLGDERLGQGHNAEIESRRRWCAVEDLDGMVISDPMFEVLHAMISGKRPLAQK
jgi:hypothetical protein